MAKSSEWAVKQWDREEPGMHLTVLMMPSGPNWYVHARPGCGILASGLAASVEGAQRACDEAAERLLGENRDDPYSFAWLPEASAGNPP